MPDLRYGSLHLDNDKSHPEGTTPPQSHSARNQGLRFSGITDKQFTEAVQNDIWREDLSENSEVVGEITKEIKEGKIRRMHPIGNTPNKAKKVTLESGLVYIHKTSADEGDKHEVAAYDLGERVLGLKRTFPITVWRDRSDHLKDGSAQLWVDNLIVGRGPLPNNDARVVDYILGHQDRITGYVPHKNKPSGSFRHANINWGQTSESSCVLFDNESTFPRKVFPYISFERMKDFIPTPELLEKIRALNMDQLKDVPHLSEEEKKYILLRRDRFIRATDAYQSGNKNKFRQLQFRALREWVWRIGAKVGSR